jgi:hypothetical protein
MKGKYDKLKKRQCLCGSDLTAESEKYTTLCTRKSGTPYVTNEYIKHKKRANFIEGSLCSLNIQQI